MDEPSEIMGEAYRQTEPRVKATSAARILSRVPGVREPGGCLRRSQPTGVVMRPLVMLGVALVVLWAVLWLGLKIATGMIHVLVIVGLAFVIWGLIKKGARAIT